MPIVDLIDRPRPEAPRRQPSALIAFGHYAPNPTTNEQLLARPEFRGAKFRVKKELVEVTPQHIFDRTGILQRSIAHSDENVVDMAEISAKIALAKLNPPQIDAVYFATSHANKQDLTGELAKRLGLKPRDRMTYHAACSSTAVAFADMATRGVLKPDDWVMLTAAESEYIKTMDPNANTLDFAIFGAESVTMVFQARALRFLGQPTVRVFPEARDLITMRVDENDMREPYKAIHVPNSNYFGMDGAGVIKTMVGEVPKLIQESRTRSGLSLIGFDAIYHPGTERVVNGIARKLPEATIYSDIKHANTSGVSVLRIWMRGAETGNIGVKSDLEVTGFGAGGVIATNSIGIAA